MGACVQCQVDVPQGSMSCPNCGATQLAAFEVPDLDLSPPPPSAKPRPKKAPAKIELGLDETPRRSSRPPPPAAQAPGPRSPSGSRTPSAPRAAVAPQQEPPPIDIDDMALGGPPIELAASPGRPVSVRPPPPGPGLAVPPERASGPRSVPPPRAPVHSPAEEVDAYKVKQAANFGPVPATPWESPIYAFRVLTRTREMKAEQLELESDIKVMEKSLSDALVEFLDRSADVMARDTTLARFFDPVKEAQGRYLERLKEIEGIDAQGQKELAEIDQEILRCERLAQEGRSTREGLSSEAARLFEAAREGDTLAGQLLDSMRTQIAQSEEEATKAIGLMTDLKRKRREVELGYVARLRDLEGALAEADNPRRAALVEVQQSLLVRPRPFEQPELSRVNLELKRLAERTQRRALLSAALTSYDRKKVTEGVVALSIALLLVVGAFVVGVMRMNRELHAPPPVVPTL